MQGMRARFRALLACVTLALLLLPHGAMPDPGGAGGRRVWGFPARLGIHLQPMTEELREYFHAPSDRGVLVTRVSEGKPADRAGVRVGDVILSVAGQPMDSPHDVILAVGSAPAAEPLRLEIVRAHERREIEVVPAGNPLPGLDPEPWIDLRERMDRGFESGRRELEHRLRDLERRLEELERRLEGSTSPNPEHT